MSQSRTMRAAFYQGARTFKPGTAPVPVPTPREALLRVRRVGICGTDLHIFQGHLDHRVPKGGIIGHETFAEIVQPPQWSDFKAGDRVVVEPLSFCGKCRACRMGASYICYDIKVLGVGLPGGMQECWAVPGERLLRIPTRWPTTTRRWSSRSRSRPTTSAAPGEGGRQRPRLRRGPIGTLIGLVCRARGARVVVAELNPFRLEMLAGLGLQTVGAGTDVVRFAEEWTEGTGVDVAFEVIGNPAVARIMTEVVRVWGTVSLVAIHAEPTPVNLYPMFARELQMRGSRLRPGGLGGGDPPGGERRGAGGAAGEPDDPARGPAGGHGAGARRRPGDEGAGGPHGLAWFDARDDGNQSPRHRVPPNPSSSSVTAPSRTSPSTGPIRTGVAIRRPSHSTSICVSGHSSARPSASTTACIRIGRQPSSVRIGAGTTE